MHDFQGYFSRNSRTLTLNVQDFPGPKWFFTTFQVLEFLRRKSRTFQEAWEPCAFHTLANWLISNVLLCCCFSPDVDIVNTEFYKNSVSSNSSDSDLDSSPCDSDSIGLRRAQNGLDYITGYGSAKPHTAPGTKRHIFYLTQRKMQQIQYIHYNTSPETKSTKFYA